MKFLYFLLSVVALVISPVSATCDAEYECEFRANDNTGAFYDLRPLCSNLPYNYSAAYQTNFIFQICGHVDSPINCIPQGYNSPFLRGSIMQFIGAHRTSKCVNPETKEEVTCTQDCEILAVGLPVFSLFDNKKPTMGVNITYAPVVSDPAVTHDPNDCGRQGPHNFASRSAHITIHCNKDRQVPYIRNVTEVSMCNYYIEIESVHGCGCVPNCMNRNCGSDGCGGFCGAVDHDGECTAGYSCASGRCCKPDCNSRTCGDDGCGGSCGTCELGAECIRNQCARVLPTPPPPPSQKTQVYYTASGGDYFGAYVGGLLSAFIVTGLIQWYSTLKPLVSASRSGFQTF